jgi:xanthine/CO dehydrogenase XdhC/CoxF family maturation factor
LRGLPRRRSAAAGGGLEKDLGSVSGGCIESAVVADVLHVIANGKSEVLEFGVADDTTRSVGLTGGGCIQIFIEKVTK